MTDNTDCRNEAGVTVGLIDSLIVIARVLVRRDLDDPGVIEALKDLAADEDIAGVFKAAHRATKERSMNSRAGRSS